MVGTSLRGPPLAFSGRKRMPYERPNRDRALRPAMRGVDRAARRPYREAPGFELACGTPDRVYRLER
jgi:hypothetical protein